MDQQHNIKTLCDLWTTVSDFNILSGQEATRPQVECYEVRRLVKAPVNVSARIWCAGTQSY